MPGKIIMDLPPTPENNRNSEGAFITLKNGNILFVYSRYGSGGLKDGSPADLYGILSSDNGETFSDPFPVLTRLSQDADNIMSVSLMRMENVLNPSSPFSFLFKINFSFKKITSTIILT